LRKSNQPRVPEIGGERRHHLDARAHTLVVARRTRTAREGDEGDDDLLTTREVAEWLGVSVQWCEIGRLRKYGPKYTRLSAKIIRYRRSDVIAWLEERAHHSTAEYRDEVA
jgi:predicted DNA-binding transcriptional regulator AlpA